MRLPRLVHVEVVIPPVGMPHTVTIGVARPESGERERRFRTPVIATIPGMAGDVGTLIGVAVGTVTTAFVALTVVGLVLLVRRARRRGPSSRRTRAGAALVRADDAVRDGADDLAFAVAQFGPDATRDLADALDAARRDLTSAFRLQARLDAGDLGDDHRAKDAEKRIRVLADRARTGLAAEAARFEAMRRAEVEAPETIRRLRAARADAVARAGEARESVADLEQRVVGGLVAPVADNPRAALALLDEAEGLLETADNAATRAAVTAVGQTLHDVEARLAQAAGLLDAVDRRRAEIEDARAGVEALRAEQRDALAAARELRDDPPDPDSGAAINDAVAALEDALSATAGRGPRDPVADLDRLVDAADDLDVALAAARNQRRRLDGAREALAGALVSARAQLGAASELIRTRGGGAGARARLEEGRRELLLAENEADPVAALDAARRAQTHARDADALARYRGA